MAAEFNFGRAETIDRLGQSFATVVEFLELVPERFTHTLPEGSPADAWTVAMNLAHLVIYEECIGAPIIADVARGGDGTGAVRSARESSFLDDAKAICDRPVRELTSRWRKAREAQMDAVREMSEARLNEAVVTAFSGQNAEEAHPVIWVATKTFQHTWEHGNAILRVALFTPR